LTPKSYKISVCTAAFQGERYIASQLQSILAQLSAGDEVIVVDDCSSDRTPDEVRALGDPRIRLLEHAANQGVMRSFEEALSRASGNVIFLSDQDDLWAPEKVSTVLQAFEANPDVTLVVTDAALIDNNGVRVGNSYYASRGKFNSGLLSNLIRCKFLGCTMAFRSVIIPKVLPFPGGDDVLHDIWIGTVNTLWGGKTLYIGEPLVLYRRHAANFTGNGRLGRLRQFRMRFHLLKAITELWIRRLPWRAEA
jgi:glycosyltransferase involved in cell wall biosynthesis